MTGNTRGYPPPKRTRKRYKAGFTEVLPAWQRYRMQRYARKLAEEMMGPDRAGT